ncbi:MAG: ABC transporter permease [Sphaerobacteraceae bacterium]|nr:MAG: ABC transporter permease [Sphaerobacteraceae bacterium]
MADQEYKPSHSPDPTEPADPDAARPPATPGTGADRTSDAVETVYDASTGAAAEDRVAVASQFQLMWWRFRRHRLAMFGGIVILLFYSVVVFADFLAYASPQASEAERSLMPPQRVYLFDDGSFSPHVFGLDSRRNPQTFQREYFANPDDKIELSFFAEGFEYNLFGFIPTNRHLIGTKDREIGESVFLLGTDVQGRDMWSRLMYATRISLTIGLVAVIVSIALGVVMGGLSGFYGGWVDMVVQRMMELLYSIPTIPLWMGLAAAVPDHWSILRIYFAITVIIALIGWTELARVVRGRLLALREEDFVMAANLAGASQFRVIFVHLVPLVLSHIIAAVSLALPAMIVAETSLSFLGLGLRPPAVSWGVLLQGAQNIQAVALTPWLLLPAIPVIVVILAFSFLGDGLRDAADPYGM